MAEVIRQNTAHKQYIEDLALYTIATNLVRALPDVRDGLKPVAYDNSIKYDDKGMLFVD